MSRVQNCFDTLSFKKYCETVDVYFLSEVSRHQASSNSGGFTSPAFLYMHLSLCKEARSLEILIKLCSDQFCADKDFQKCYLLRRASNWTDRGLEYVSGQDYFKNFRTLAFVNNISRLLIPRLIIKSSHFSFFRFFVALQPFVEPWSIFSFLNFLQIR